MNQLLSSITHSKLSMSSTATIIFASSILVTLRHQYSNNRYSSRHIKPSSVRLLSSSAREDRVLKLTNRDQLPSLTSLVSSLILGSNSKSSGSKSENSVGVDEREAALVSVIVDNFTFSMKEKTEFEELCGTGAATSAHIFPHVIGQQCLLALLTHPETSKVIPFSLIGALHLRSYFETLHADKLRDFCRNSNDNSITSHTMNASLWGTAPSSNGKGTEIVLSLSLFASEKEGNDKTEIWRETLVWYSAHKPSKMTTNNRDSKAQALIEKYNALCPDFANITKEKNSTLKYEKVFQCTGAETWRFGILSGDVNPIHMSTPLAWILGQKGRIAHGAMVLGRALSLLEAQINKEDNKGSALSAIKSAFGVSLKGPVPCTSFVSLLIDEETSTALKKFDVFAGKSDRPSICVRSF